MRAAVLVLAILETVAAAAGLTFRSTDGRSPCSLATTVRGEVGYVRLDDLAWCLGGRSSWIPGRRRALLLARGDSVAITVDSRFIAINGTEVCLQEPVVARDGVVWVPEEFAVRVPPLLTGVRAMWVDSLAGVVVEASPCDLTLRRVVEDTMAVRLEVALPSGAEWRLSPFRGDSTVLTVTGATVCLDDFDGILSDSAVVSLAVRQEAGRAVLVARRRALGISSRCLERGGVLSWHLGVFPEPRWVIPVVRRVVIDPGHGGSDEGTRSADGVREKDVTLACATRLAGHLTRHGIEAVLTRTHDVTTPQATRIQVAGTAGADLFVSLHCDWSFDRSRRGLHVVFPGPNGRSVTSVRADDLLTFEEPEAVAPSGPPSPLVPVERASARWLGASARAAEAVTRAVLERGLVAAPPTQGAFIALQGLSMPSISVELGYLSHPVEARDLASTSSLDELAEAIATGLARLADPLLRTFP